MVWERTVVKGLNWSWPDLSVAQTQYETHPTPQRCSIFSLFIFCDEFDVAAKPKFRLQETQISLFPFMYLSNLFQKSKGFAPIRRVSLTSGSIMLRNQMKTHRNPVAMCFFSSLCATMCPFSLFSLLLHAKTS